MNTNKVKTSSKGNCVCNSFDISDLSIYPYSGLHFWERGNGLKMGETAIFLAVAQMSLFERHGGFGRGEQFMFFLCSPWPDQANFLIQSFFCSFQTKFGPILFCFQRIIMLMDRIVTFTYFLNSLIGWKEHKLDYNNPNIVSSYLTAARLF